MPTYLSILVIAIVLQIIGVIWYGPKLFGPAWMRVMGVDPNMSKEAIKAQHQKMTANYVLNFVLSIITVLVLGWALGNENSVLVSLKLSFVIWLGFAMPMLASSAIWSGKSKALARDMFLIGAGYQLVAFLVAGILIVIL